MEKKYSMEEYCRIIETLRSENGCPWDKKQTHQSLRPCMMEEAAEFVASVRIWEECGNIDNMIEELGDILLQVVMHAQIAKEEGLFSMEDVIYDNAEKMIRRHPHVFGEKSVLETEEVKQNWEEIKQKEKEGKSWILGPLSEIPAELPTLRRAEKTIRKIHQIYEPQKDVMGALDAMEECIFHLRELYREESAVKEKAQEAVAEDEKNEASEQAIRKEKELVTFLLTQLTNLTGQRRLYADQLLVDALEDEKRKYES